VCVCLSPFWRGMCGPVRDKTPPPGSEDRHEDTTAPDSFAACNIHAADRRLVGRRRVQILQNREAAPPSVVLQIILDVPD
jgi:hypothetical protein